MLKKHTVNIFGIVGREPEKMFSSSGKAFTRFSLASSFKGKDDTIWFNVTVFGSTADFAAEYVRKGDSVFVSGSLSPDPETGSPRVWGEGRASYDIAAFELNLLSSKANTPTDNQSAHNKSEDEIPF